MLTLDVSHLNHFDKQPSSSSATQDSRNTNCSTAGETHRDDSAANCIQFDFVTKLKADARLGKCMGWYCNGYGRRCTDRYRPRDGEPCAVNYGIQASRVPGCPKTVIIGHQGLFSFGRRDLTNPSTFVRVSRSSLASPS